MIVSEALATRRNWETVDVDPLPAPIVLGGIKNEPPQTSVWWKLIGAVTLLTAGGTLMGGGVLSVLASAGVVGLSGTTLLGFGIGLSAGAFYTFPALRDLLMA